LSNEVNPSKRRNRKRILFAVFAILLLLMGVLLIACGAALFAYNSGADSEGYSISEPYTIKTSANAFVVWVRNMNLNPMYAWIGADNLAKNKWIITSINSEKEVFAGWARAADCESYISFFTHETPNMSWHWYTEPYYAEIEIPSTAIEGQGAPTRPPTQEGFWTKSVSTSDSAAIYWDPVWDANKGMNMLVIMNADGSSNVNATFQLGHTVPILQWLPYLLIPFGIVLCVGGLLLIRKRRRII
jgi:hypothetical protein